MQERVSQSAYSEVVVGLALRNRFALRNRIGGGGMGEVFAADDLQTNRKVAVKRLPPNLQPRSLFLQRFFEEARMVRHMQLRKRY